VNTISSQSKKLNEPQLININNITKYILQCFDDYFKFYNDPLKNRPTAKNLIALYTYFHKDAKTSENFLCGEIVVILKQATFLLYITVI